MLKQNINEKILRLLIFIILNFIIIKYIINPNLTNDLTDTEQVLITLSSTLCFMFVNTYYPSIVDNSIDKYDNK